MDESSKKKTREAISRMFEDVHEERKSQEKPKSAGRLGVMVMDIPKYHTSTQDKLRKRIFPPEGKGELMDAPIWSQGNKVRKKRSTIPLDEMRGSHHENG
jgi:hypothetical protein